MSNGYDRLEAEWSFTDQEREAYDYEFNAQFDRWDGYGDIDAQTEIDYDDAIGCAADYRFDDLDDYEEIDENGVPYDHYDRDEYDDGTGSRDDIPF